MKKIFFIIGILFVTILISGCIKTKEPESPEKICINLCIEKKEQRIDLSTGPCLSDENPNWKIKDWVCDIAHYPRQDIDNKVENQCQEFRNGTAKHFVEVNTECNLIKTY